MSYTPTNWSRGDVVTSAKLNKLENGVADASGGGVLVVNAEIDPETGIATLDKTWQEIYDSKPFVLRLVFQDAVSQMIISSIHEMDGVYTVRGSGGGPGNTSFETNSASGYPSVQLD